MPKNTNDTRLESDESESDLPKGLGKPATRALTNAGYLKLEQFGKVTEAEVLKLHGMGPKALGLIRLALAEKGLTFANSSKEDRS
ncbi:DNA-binding protein [Paenibacillus eucommiae]|uniref:DNA-directed RNA polymerase alpha subunit n=1 Tax=Paenibacillus eucommiae TaxID=1355755 RepID=A0ABS4IQQ7_9BACL|nr:DNA-binding protein [Paenibacillus eucommiae]MBP1989910.1 DNA-directed RNA polymerase alpha subunit [Paenibacillus eucommiae]